MRGEENAATRNQAGTAAESQQKNTISQHDQYRWLLEDKKADELQRQRNGGVGSTQPLRESVDFYQQQLTQPTNPKSLAPQRVTCMPQVATERKAHPVATGVLDYFPDALVAIAHVSYVGNEQHNPGQPLHWDRSKSQDEADALMRHFLERGTIDSCDGLRHSAKMAWRALALLQKEIEAAR